MCKPPQSDDATIQGVSASSSNDGGVGVMSGGGGATTTNNNDSGGKVVTLKELNAHNTPKDAWASVHGQVIDITEFGKRHPGGDIIFLVAGKDATVLFETYHPRGVSPALLRKLQVGVMKEGELKESYYSWNSKFYKTLKQRVCDRLEEMKLSRRGSMEIWIKAILILIGFWGSLIKMYTAQHSTFAACMWCMSMGVFAAFVGTCIQHDGNHGAFSTNKTLNTMAGWTLDMIGASAYTWEFQHMLGHHPYTNVLNTDSKQENDQESDPDVFSSYPAMRMHPGLSPPAWYQKYQHLYAPILFSFMTLSKVMQQDIEVAVTKRLYHIDANCRYGSLFHLIRFWTMKVITTVYMMILPCYFHGIVKGLGLFLLGHMTCGQVLATMFIVNHVIEGVSYGQKDAIVTVPTTTTTISSNDQPLVETSSSSPYQRPTVATDGSTPMEATLQVVLEQNKKDKNVPVTHYNDWAAVQCQTSVNWSSGSWFWNHFSGGLSHQIEHHLFPSICHTNYVYIQDVVQSTCQEYGVPYQSESNIFIAYFKMLRHLKHLGTTTSTTTTNNKKLD